jgi:hypothetical protein
MNGAIGERMASPDIPASSGKSTILSLIAWLSVCLLATAWGPKLDASLRDRSAEIGALGLAAAVGLEVTGRTRGHIKKRSQQKAAGRRLTRNLVKVAAHNTAPTVDVIPHIDQKTAGDDGLVGKVD